MKIIVVPNMLFQYINLDGSENLKRMMKTMADTQSTA